MRSRQTAFLILCFVIFLPSQHVFGQLTSSTYADALRTKRATLLLTHVHSPQFAILNDEGKLEGLCVDVMEAFGDFLQQEKGIATVFKRHASGNPEDFDLFMSEMRTAKGAVFGIGNITITDERKAYYQFSPSLISNFTMFISNQSAPDISEASSIPQQWEGYHAYAVKGTTNEQEILKLKSEHFPSLEIRYKESSEEIIDMIPTDPRGFANVDFIYYMALNRDSPIKKHLLRDSNKQELGIVLPKNSDWQPVFKEFMNGFKNTIEYKKLLTDHLGTVTLRLLGTM